MAIKPWDVGVAAPVVKRLRLLATALSVVALAVLLVRPAVGGPALSSLAVGLVVLSLAVRSAAGIWQSKVERRAWAAQSRGRWSQDAGLPSCPVRRGPMMPP